MVYGRDSDLAPSRDCLTSCPVVLGHRTSSDQLASATHGSGHRPYSEASSARNQIVRGPRSEPLKELGIECRPGEQRRAAVMSAKDVQACYAALLDQAGAQHSQSPIEAKGDAAILHGALSHSETPVNSGNCRSIPCGGG